MNSHNCFSQREEGAMALLFAVIFLPFLFFIFSIALDLNAYFQVSEGARRFADEAVLRGSKFFPSESRALAAVDDVARQYGFTSSDYSAEVKDGFLSVDVEKAFPLFFARYFNDGFALPIRKFATSRSTPTNISLLIDTSSYFAPSIGTWGDASEWGEAQFFADHPQLQMNFAAPTSVIAHTQGCFNPAFNRIKLSGIRAYDYVSRFAQNAVMVGIFPGNGYEQEFVRPLVTGGKIRENDASGEAIFLNAVSNVNAPSWCGAAAEFEGKLASPNRNYVFPRVETNPIFRPPNSTEPIALSEAFYAFNTNYLPQLSVAQSIWSATVASKMQDTSTLLMQAVSELAQSAGVGRRGLVGRELRNLVILSGGFPRRFDEAIDNDSLVSQIAPIAESIRSNRQMALQIFYVILHTNEVLGANVASARSQAEALSERVQQTLVEVQTQYATENLAERFGVTVLFSAGDFDDVLENILQAIEARRVAVLAG